MVKGISRQVIVVHSPDPKVFEQAIFIVREDAKDITDEMLLKQAKQAIRGSARAKKSKSLMPYAAGWSCVGAAVMALIWLISGIV